jgi:Fe-Mn family superoxide dismutase
MYTAKEFTFPELKGISAQTMTEHMGLYNGYVKNTNTLLEKLGGDIADNYARAEMQRRFSFEFNGMKNHEYYFADLSAGPSAIPADSKLTTKISEQFGSFENWMVAFKNIAKTRGVGWAILYYDRDQDLLINSWVDEQHLGHLNSCQYIFGIDMWEHSFVADYQPSGKGQYIQDYTDQVDWAQVAERFSKAAG